MDANTEIQKYEGKPSTVNCFTLCKISIYNIYIQPNIYSAK